MVAIKKQCSIFILFCFCVLFFSQNLFAISEDDLFKQLSQENIGVNEVNRLLEMIVTQMEPTGNNSWTYLDLPKQEELIKLALGKGGKFSAIKLERCRLPLYGAANLMLNDPSNTVNPDEFLNSILQSSC